MSRETGRMADRLDRMTREGLLFRRLAKSAGDVVCHACAQRCRVKPGKRGVCQLRHNRDGALWVPAGYVAGLAIDPIEKKPLYHVLPGCEALSFGMLGCNLRCDFCQNWVSSQALRDPASSIQVRQIAAREIVELAVARGAPVIASTYNEPLITSEWSAEIMGLGKEHGLKGAYISNGFATAEALEFLRPVLDIYKIDLKSFQDANYKRLGGRLQPVLDTIGRAWGMGYWVEIVTLVIPGFNDSDGELREMAAFIAGVSRDIPWHVTAFHPDYKETTGTRPTGVRDIERAAQAGADAGLRFVYAGNLRGGSLAELEHTRCPNCATTLIRRAGFRVLEARIGRDGCCPQCRAAIPGVWA